VRALLASPLGFLIGISLGAVGGGGSVLAVPALVYVAGQTPQDAVTTSLLVVGVAAVAGLVHHAREGRVRAGTGIAFGAAGIGGAVAGSVLNHGVDPDVLLLAFSGLMVAAAVAMKRRAPCESEPVPVVASTAGPVRGLASATRLDPARVVRVLVCGTGVGFVTGFFGVGGGFVIVPALVVCMGFAMPEAAATSLLVIALNAGTSLVARTGTGTLEWRVAVPFTVAAVIGSVVGSRIAGRVDHDRLVSAFVVLLVVVAGYTAVRSIGALL
jgi:uncharacterized membrane protein YfcA